MLVRAKAKGFYGVVRQPGDTFEIAKKEDLGKWMEPVEPVKPAKEEGSKK